MNDQDHEREDQLLAEGAYGPAVTNNLEKALPYKATCRDEECLMHLSPARFATYEDRATAVGQHRIRTGHKVDMPRPPGDQCPHCKAHAVRPTQVQADTVMACGRCDRIIT